MSAEDLADLLSVDKQAWLDEIPGMKEHYATFGDKLPSALNDELAALEKRLV